MWRVVRAQVGHLNKYSCLVVGRVECWREGWILCAALNKNTLLKLHIKKITLTHLHF